MRYTLLSFLCAATVIAYLQRSALGVPSKKIEGDLALGPSDMGLVWLAWYAGYAAFQLPAGWLADRFGSKPTLIAFSVAWSALTAATGAATGFAGLAVLWALMGVAQAGIFVCATKAIGATFPRTEQAIASGALGCGMAGGAALSQFVTGQLLGPLTWQQILVAYAVPGVVWAVVFGLAVPKPEGPAPPPVTQPATPRVPVYWSRLLTDRNMILLAAQQFMRAGAAALFFTWFPRYLQEAFAVSKEKSGEFAAYPLLAGMAGGLLGGTISDWLLRRTGRPRLARQGLGFVGTSLCAATAVTAYLTGTVACVVALASAAGFGVYAAGVSAYATALSMGGTRVAPVFATMNMAGNIGAGVFPFALGLLVGGTGNWNVTLLLFASMLAASAACWAFLNPTGTLFEEHP